MTFDYIVCNQVIEHIKAMFSRTKKQSIPMTKTAKMAAQADWLCGVTILQMLGL